MRHGTVHRADARARRNNQGLCVGARLLGELKKIGLIVDNPKRDLAGLALLAHELAKHGVGTAFVPLYQQGSDVPLLGLDAVVLNYARANNRALMEGYRELGLPLFVLDTEGGAPTEAEAINLEHWATLVRQTGLSELIDGVFFWGGRVREVFNSHSGINARSLHVTGCPRYDLCAPPWRALLSYHRSDYVLINTLFSSVNPRFSDSVEREKIVMRSVGWDADYVERMFTERLEQFGACQHDLQRLVAANPRTSFVLRPHPFERQEPYERAFAKLGNVAIDASGDVMNVIRNARCIVHMGCSTAIESTLLGRVPISMEYLITPFLRKHAPGPSRVSYQAESFEALDHAVKNIDEITAAHDFEGIHRSEIEPWYHLADGRAAARVADILLAVLTTRDGSRTRISLSRSLAGSHLRPTALQRLQGAVNMLFGSRFGTVLRCLISPQRRHKRFDLATVGNWLAAYRKADGNSMPAIVRHARHPLHGVPLESIEIHPAVADRSV